MVKSLSTLRIKVAIYLRVSTQEQAREGFSIAAQRERLTRHAELKDWDIYDIYVDEGRSAKDTDRPELQRMLADAKQKKIDVILFFKLDRFTRSVKDLYSLWEELEKYGVDLHSCTEPIDTTTPIGRALMGLLGIFAQLERETIAERVGFGMEQKVREGGWHGGPVAFGYVYNGGESLEINEEEAELVRLIFQMYISGMGEDKLTIWLNQNGKTKDGEPWGARSINYLLQNQIYIGNYEWNKGEDDYFIVENAVPAILDKETFNLAQEVRKGRRSVHPRQATSIHVFSGRLACMRCGGQMKGQTYKLKDKNYYYYICINKTRKKCDAPQVPAEKLETAFKRYMKHWSNKEETVAAAKEIQNEDHSKEIKRLETELEKIKKRRKKWLMDLGNDIITQEEFREMTDEDREREKAIRELLEGYKQSSTADTLDSSEIAALLQNMLLQWEYSTPIEKKTLLQILTKKIYVEYDKTNIKIDIEY